VKKQLLLIIACSLIAGISAKANPDESVKIPAVYRDSSSYDVSWYAPSVEFTLPYNGITAHCRIAAKATKQPLRVFYIELTDSLTVDSALFNNKRVAFSHAKGWIRLKPDKPVPDGSLFMVNIYYHGETTASGIFGGGINHRSSEEMPEVVWSQSEAFDARLWFPCKQVLTDKADSSQVTIITPDSMRAGSNGLLTSERSLPGKRKEYVWTSHYPVAYYLISIAASQYRDYTYTVELPDGKKFPVINYIYNLNGLYEQYKGQLDSTALAIKLYSQLFGEYPFVNEKYGHCQAPFGGGMEHQTMTTLYNFDFILVAHELAHQWFGNSVTCATWQDIWVNEGFASYAEYLACENILSPTDARNWLDECQHDAKSDRKGSVFIPDGTPLTDERVFSNELTYKKGGAIIHTLRHEINNDSLFFRVLRAYLNTYKNGNATGNDFCKVLNDVTNEDYTWFFKQWFYGEGYPVYTINWHQKGDSLYIESNQVGTSVKTPFFRATLDFKIVPEHSGVRDTTVQLFNTHAGEQFVIPYKGEIKRIKFNPEKWLLCASTIQKTANASSINKVQGTFDSTLGISFATPAKRKIYLTNLDGEKILEKNISGKNCKIDTTKIKAGIYNIQIAENNTIQNALVVKQ
jgi:aminopeptidase N